MNDRWLLVDTKNQCLIGYDNCRINFTYVISTAKNGLGEIAGSECTPRGWHGIHQIIGQDALVNSVFVGRKWTGEIYSAELAQQFPLRDWIITRILWLTGLEKEFNQGGVVDTLSRHIYLHGTPDEFSLGRPSSHGCIRMKNEDIIALTNWVSVGTRVKID